jgi:hypothetical protein
MLPDYDVSGYSVEERIVQAGDDLCTVFQRVDQTAVVKGAERSGSSLVDVWVREADAWRVWRRHSTPLSPARRARGMTATPLAAVRPRLSL